MKRMTVRLSERLSLKPIKLKLSTSGQLQHADSLQTGRVSMAAVMAGRIQILIFVFCWLSMEFDCGGDYNYDNGIQEEFWDDGFDNTQDYHQEPAPRPAPPPEPRKLLKMPWQAVLSLQILPGGN